MNAPTIKPPSDAPAIRVVMMPRDTNAANTIFGGVLLSYIDQAGFVEARRQAAHRYVTVAMHEVKFHEPVFVGDTVSFWTVLGRIGTTSITMHVTVETERDGESRLLTQAEVTYVSVELRGDERRPVSIRGATK